MSSFNEEEFVVIDCARLIDRCNELAEKCIEDGDILPPVSWFQSDKKHLAGFCLFDFSLKRRFSRLFHHIGDVIRFHKKPTNYLPNLFAIRCMALFAAQQMKLAFLYDYNTTKSELKAVDEDHALYWALTSFWRYSTYENRALVWDKERGRLEFRHDISLLNDKWQRGKLGKALMLEQAQRKEREARHEWEQSVQAVKRLKRTE